MNVRLDLTGSRSAVAFPIAIHNKVLFTLVIVAVAAVVSLGFISYAPNRLVSGASIPLWVAAGGLPTIAIAILGAILLAACCIAPNTLVHYVVAVAAGLLLLLVLAEAGHAASVLASNAKPLRACLWVQPPGFLSPAPCSLWLTRYSVLPPALAFS